MTRQFGHGPMNFRMMSPAIKALIIANIVVYVLQQIVGPQFVFLFGLVPYEVTHQFHVWQPFTYLFLHGGMFHLLFNLFALWMFGMPVEAEWGPREFLKFVLVCGVGAGLVSVILTPNSPAPIIGASGAVYGLLVAFAMLFPEAVVYLYFFFPIKAKHMAILFGMLEFLASTSSTSPGVARFAHLGGMLIGYLYIRWWNSVRIYARSFALELLRRGGATRRPSRKKKRSRSRREETEEEPLRYEAPRSENEAAEVDRILDKILSHGEESLTEAERKTLRRQAKRKPEGHA